MLDLHTHKAPCPYCGELIELLVDCSLAEQSYIEDCSVCCRPIVIYATCEEDTAQVQLFAEDE